MHANRTEIGSEGTTRRASLGLRSAAVLIALVWGFVDGNKCASAAELLRWKFKEGETLRFSIEQKMVSNTKGMGVEHKSNRTQSQEIMWKVLSVGAGGEAEINHRVLRIKLKAEDPPYAPFEFDSADVKQPQPGFEAMIRQLKAEVGAEFTFKMKPTGEIIDIKVPEETLKRYRDAAPPGGPAPEINEKSLKDVLMQSSPPSFPEGALEPGKTWSPKPARMPLALPGPNPPFATLVLDTTFTYQGADPKSPNLWLVAIDTNGKVEPIEGLDVKVMIRRQEGKGSLTIDSQAGHMVSTRNSMKLDITITGGMGQAIEQSSEMNSSMTLLP
jgi:hypothetical protein